MNNIILNISEIVFGYIKGLWKSQKVNRIISYVMVFVFISSIIISYLDFR